jgi:hypothetical protein
METHRPRVGTVRKAALDNGAPTRVACSDAGTAAFTAFPESLTGEALLAAPALADRWPDGHPARTVSWMPLKPRIKGNRT